MRYAIFISILMLSACEISSAQTYGLDNTDPAVFSKFKIPETDLHAFWFTSSLYGSAQKYSSLFETGPNYNSTNRAFSMSISPNYRLLRESDDSYFSFNGMLNGGYSFNDAQSEGPGITFNNYQKNGDGNLTVSLGETYRSYATSSEFFYSVISSGQFSDAERYSSRGLPDSTRSNMYYGTKSQSYSFALGIGWGKMRDVTSVVSAVRFQERLKQLSLVNSNLSDKTIEDLAQQFYRQGYYSQVHVRPDKFFWEDIGKTLARDGVSLGGLNEYAYSYLREVPGELRFMRNEGFVTGVGIGLQYYNNYYSASYGSAGPRINEQLVASGNVYVNFSHQLNLNSQVWFDVGASGGPNLTKHQDLKQNFELKASVGYDYELTDRIVVSASNYFDEIFQNSSMHGRNLSDQTTISMNYFVEDNISMNGSYSLNYYDSKDLSSTQSHTRQITNYLSVGLTYYIDRGLMLGNSM